MKLNGKGRLCISVLIALGLSAWMRSSVAWVEVSVGFVGQNPSGEYCVWDYAYIEQITNSMAAADIVGANGSVEVSSYAEFDDPVIGSANDTRTDMKTDLHGEFISTGAWAEVTGSTEFGFGNLGTHSGHRAGNGSAMADDGVTVASDARSDYVGYT